MKKQGTEQYNPIHANENNILGDLWKFLFWQARGWFGGKLNFVRFLEIILPSSVSQSINEGFGKQFSPLTAWCHYAWALKFSLIHLRLEKYTRTWEFLSRFLLYSFSHEKYLPFCTIAVRLEKAHLSVFQCEGSCLCVSPEI